LFFVLLLRLSYCVSEPDNKTKEPHTTTKPRRSVRVDDGK
jgi:hypothetical protein